MPTATEPAAGHSLLWIVALLTLLLLPAAVVVALFYRRTVGANGVVIEAVDDDEDDWVPAPPPPPLVPIPARPRPGVAERARLGFEFRPRRAGTNVTSAAVDYELVVHNTGDAIARDVRIGLGMATAGNDHDAHLKAFFDAPVDRPIVAPFDLAPGEHRALKAMVMLPKDAVNVVTVKGRPMFVPMVAVNALYGWDGGAGQTASSHVVGIERGEGERMRPFWLDVTPRMHGGVGERRHALAVNR